MSQQDNIQRSILPIPDRPYLGVRPFNAKDPAARFPPIEPLRPPTGSEPSFPSWTGRTWG
jgi:arylsulfatase